MLSLAAETCLRKRRWSSRAPIPSSFINLPKRSSREYSIVSLRHLKDGSCSGRRRKRLNHDVRRVDNYDRLHCICCHHMSRRCCDRFSITGRSNGQCTVQLPLLKWKGLANSTCTLEASINFTMFAKFDRSISYRNRRFRGYPESAQLRTQKIRHMPLRLHPCTVYQQSNSEIRRGE